MTKTIKILTIAAAFFAVVGCSDAKKEAEIANLQAVNANLKKEIETLKQQLDSTQAASEAFLKRLDGLDLGK